VEKLREELADLEGRSVLEGRLDEVLEWVKSLGLLRSLDAAHGALATNKITIFQGQLSREIITTALDARLRGELESMKCAHLPINLKPTARVGATRVQLRLAGVSETSKISAIASEGEHRALSLAFFFAELTLADGDGGIVVDDPVSSLDEERRAYIAARLVEEAGQRQVVVFTHDLPFMLDLAEQARAAGLKPVMKGLWRHGEDVGRVDEQPPFAAMRAKDRLGVLKQQAAQWDGQPDPKDLEEAWRRVRDFYGRLRTAWERSVEERLFRGVVQRFQREVKTQSLKDVVITPETVGMVERGMSRCSAFMHDAAPATPVHLPGRAEIEADVGELDAFFKATQERRGGSF